MFSYSQILSAEILKRGSKGSFWETPYEIYCCPVSPFSAWSVILATY